MANRVFSVGLLVFILAASAGRPSLVFAAEEAGNVAAAENMTAEDVDRIVAGLSDEQARRMLVDALQRQAQQEAPASSDAAPRGANAWLEGIRNLVARLQARIEALSRNQPVAADELPGMFTFLGMGEVRGKKAWVVIFTVIGVLAGGLMVEGLFLFYTKNARARVVSSEATRWRSKLGILAARGLMESLAISLFALSSLVFFFLFLEGSTGERVLLATYLTAIAAVQTVYLLSRFFLAPAQARLRLFPIGNAAAVYLHRGIMVFSAVYIFGMLTCGIVRIAGATELDYLKATTLVALAMMVVIIWMILQKRSEVADYFSRGVPESSLRYRLARKWHTVSVAGVIALFIFSFANRILGFSAGKGILTLFMVPLYFLLDWMLREALDRAFGIVSSREEVRARDAEPQNFSGNGAKTEPVEKETGGVRFPPLGRMKEGIRVGLRAALGILLVLWTLKVWGLSFPVGEAVASGAFRILLVVLICYVLWVVVTAAIQRRLQQEMPETEDEEAEEGGPGGSRVTTLLILMRKFLTATIVVIAGLMILSALGVNIGPLIAGAGVIGLAIGFGAQTLVKDIISGVFFLIDDAFRVGDYVEVSGTKGMVEQISLRSLRLRHPRGQVNFIPFGEIATVTNLSRDYIITKLDFRVRYDTDVEKVRKIIKKKVYGPIMKNPELANKLLDKIKSQGVREMDDSAMIMRVKYKTRPGDQFVIRRHVYQLMREAFQEEGIEFAHRNVTVYMPPEVQQNLAQTDDETREKAIEMAAGAAITAIHADGE